jgi:hypothetical protein
MKAPSVHCTGGVFALFTREKSPESRWNPAPITITP